MKAAGKPQFLSLRWKALITLSAVLLVVNASLAILAYRQSVGQFELQQSSVRDRQSRQLETLLDNGYQSMSKIASFVPLLESAAPAATIAGHLQQVLDRHGSMLDLEWDIRAVQLITPTGVTAVAWPEAAAKLPRELENRIAATKEVPVSLLLCRSDCRQYQASPTLWNARFSGTLVLSRSLADSLLTFSAVTDAEVVILTETHGETEPGPGPRMLDGTGMAMHAMTHPQRVGSQLRKAARMGLLSASMTAPVIVHQGSDWYEIFRIDSIAPGVHALIVNLVTLEQAAIRDATRNSILIGILGLALSETLLLMVMRTPLTRIGRLVGVLPLLAESRFDELRDSLPVRRPGRAPIDEIDVMVDTVGSLTDRMDVLQVKREEAESRLVWLADHDPLTHLFNRRRFGEEFARVRDQALRYDHTGALLFFDLDQFKDVNDLSGHQAGDILLQMVAEKLRDFVCSTDLLGRLGGDEFGLLLPKASADYAEAVADQVLQLVEKIVLTARKHRHRGSASIGIVLFPEHGIDTRQLLANADLAMYQAKEKGRGRWHLFSDEDQALEKVDARVLWTDQIEQALKDGRFELHFQPIMEIATGKIRRAEALIRMRDVHGQLIFPDSFIAVAEKTGQIQAIDHWVLMRAIEIMASRPGLHLSVNLSGHAMEDETILPDLQCLLEASEIEANRLTLEITETAAVNSLLNATRLMRRIQDLGCRFALDDFGSGFASYAYLRRLPVNDVKIDGSFIRELARSSEDKIFVKAISDVAHSIGKGVVAEFVENKEILAVLAELGVEYAQGYYIGRPVPEGELKI